MDKVMTMHEIESQYDDEWVLLTELETDESLQVKRGQVICHSKDRDEVYRKAIELHPHRFAVLHTGEMPSDVEFAL